MWSSRLRRGFTLLEVLAAVAVLGIVYTMLARAAMQGLADEGEAARRLEASLLADQTLSDLEAALLAGAAPPIGQDEREEGDFRIAFDVQPFDASALLPPNEDVRPGEPAPSYALLTGVDRNPSPLLQVHVSVFWQEGVFEQSVSRTTWGLDPVAAAPLLEALGSEDGDGSGDEEPDDVANDPEPEPNPETGAEDTP